MEWYDVVSIVFFLVLLLLGCGLSLRFAMFKPRTKTLLLDADGTLFDFEKSEYAALEKAFEELSIPFDSSVHGIYHRNNDACWKALERGEISRDELKVRRFRDTFAELGVDMDPQRATEVYERALGSFAFPFDGAMEACRRLSKKYALYIVTNGLKNVQTSRMLQTPLPEIVKGFYISEDVGYAKPAPEYFDRFFADHPECKRCETVIVGDSLSSDILGGNNAGIRTCWVNRKGESRPEDLRIDLEISNITNLEKAL